MSRELFKYELPKFLGIGKASSCYQESPNKKEKGIKGVVISNEDTTYDALTKKRGHPLAVYPKENTNHPSTKKKLKYRSSRLFKEKEREGLTANL